MAEDIDKLIKRMEAEAKEADSFGMMNATTFSAAAHALQSLRSRVSELEAERDRTLRNRDMWKGQSERQAATIRGLRNSVHTAIIELAALVPNPRCVGNDDWPECLNAADRQCLTDAYDALDAVRNNTDTGPQAQVRAETGASVVPDGWQLVPKEPSWEVLIDHGLDSDTWAALLAALPTPPAAEAVGGALAEITAERRRQIEREGWSPDHDDGHSGGELAQAAGCYALHAGHPPSAQVRPGFAPQDWPWAAEWWKPKDPRRDLIRAAALIVAEIERLDRVPQLQRERGDVAGQDGLGGNCALKGTGPAASTASDDLVKEIGQSMDVQYAIGSIINNEGSFFTGRGERMDRLVRAVLSSPPVLSLRSSLFDLVEAVEASVDPKETCAALWSRVDDSRSILSRFQPVAKGGMDADEKGQR